jgi:hypothetical protein
MWLLLAVRLLAQAVAGLSFVKDAADYAKANGFVIFFFDAYNLGAMCLRRSFRTVRTVQKRRCRSSMWTQDFSGRANLGEVSPNRETGPQRFMAFLVNLSRKSQSPSS